MATLRLYPSGFTTYLPVRNPSRVPPKKTAVQGWTLKSTRSLVRFLYSINAQAVSGLFSFSLTVKVCPPSPDDWKRLRESFFRALRHHNITTIVWLTEWQARGVPHLHGIIILPAGFSRLDLIRLWLKVAKAYLAAEDAQDCKHIYDTNGWMEYLGKHSARGVTNYQRNSRNIPREWNGKTGRIWGKRGEWPTLPPIELCFTEPIFFRLRRVIRSRMVSLARSRKDYKSLSYARSMLKSNDLTLSRIKGLSQFCRDEFTLSLLESVRQEGKIHHG